MEISDKMTGVLRRTIKEASKSDHRQHKMACSLLRGGNIISISHNSGHLHTEHSSLNRAWRSDTEDTTAVVVRVRRNGSLGMAKPCDLCLKRLIKAGVKRVIYTNAAGQLEQVKLSGFDVVEVHLEYHFVGPSYEKRR